ncbi:MAG: hypothetical protein H0U66_03670 [Gemmatimonadaceae bacterium]|nr:hypothetical protein [Gemmatimonadaceae bacterium]
MLIDAFYFMTRRVEVFVPLGKRLLWKLSSMLPGNLVLVAIVAAVPVLALFLLLEWQFARAETTSRVQPASGAL